MTAFIAKAACRGKRPARLGAPSPFYRPNLVAQLMADRRMTRALVAPAGFGKTTLALEYSDTVFSFAHVFWVNCESPCFLRDLDGGSIAQLVLQADPVAQLVVFDDLPFLDSARCALFAEECRQIISFGCEVLVVCDPAHEQALDALDTCLILRSDDLLLSASEVDALRTVEDRTRVPFERLPACDRVPALAWPSENSLQSMLERALPQALPAPLRAALVTALVVQEGNLSWLVGFSGVGERELAALERDYPHTGVDMAAGRFSNRSFPLEDMAAAFKSQLAGVAQQVGLPDSTALAQAWGDVLVGFGRAARACDIVRLFCNRARRGSWACPHARELLEAGAFLPLEKLLDSARSTQAPARAIEAAVESVCLVRLGNAEEAIARARRAAVSDTSFQETRLLGLLVLARQGWGPVRDNALQDLRFAVEALEGAGEGAGEGAVLCADTAPAAAGADTSPAVTGQLAELALVVRGFLASTESAEALAGFWERAQGEGAPRWVLCLLAAWLFDALAAEAADPLPSWGPVAAPAAVESYVRAQLGAGLRPGGDIFAASAGLALEQAHVRGVLLAQGPLETAAMLELRQVEMRLVEQRRLYGEWQMRLESDRVLAVATHPDADLAPQASRIAVAPRRYPPLEVKLFGHFECRQGKRDIPAGAFRREKSRHLFIMLAMAHGRELVRDVAVQRLWPTSGLDTARKNYYTILSEVRRVVGLPDGTCPYLVQYKLSCRLDGNLVNVDLDRFDAVCRQMLFGSLEEPDWSRLFREAETAFGDELLPAETRLPGIEAERRLCHERLSEALVVAAARILDAGGSHWAVQYARSAVARDPLREDAYAALMHAQVALGQRTAALMTYLNCRRALADGLGVEPSPELQELYRALLDGGALPR